jgi:hypothetical protein
VKDGRRSFQLFLKHKRYRNHVTMLTHSSMGNLILKVLISKKSKSEKKNDVKKERI